MSEQAAISSHGAYQIANSYVRMIEKLKPSLRGKIIGVELGEGGRLISYSTLKGKQKI